MTQDHPTLSGPLHSWHISVKTPLGEEQGTLELQIENQSCRGRLYNEAGELSLENLRIDGLDLSWKLHLSQPIPMEIVCRAAVQGDHIEGTATVAAFGDITFTGTRSTA